VEADATAAELAAARGAVAETKDDVSTIGRQAYMGSDDSFGDVALLLDADSPTEVLQQAATLEVLGKERTKVLAELEQAEVRQDRADRAARTAVADRDQLARAAAEAEAAANQHLADAQSSFDGVSAEKAALEAQLREAEIRLLTIQGAADAEAAWAAQQAAPSPRPADGSPPATASAGARCMPASTSPLRSAPRSTRRKVASSSRPGRPVASVSPSLSSTATARSPSTGTSTRCS
jgi:hypothetical protein